MIVREEYVYDGPGWADWLVTLAASFLIAAEIKTQAAKDALQSAASYYFQSPEVPRMHTAALVVNGLILALAVVWLVSPWKTFAKWAMGATALAGVLLCWRELIFAVHVQEGAVFVLPNLPFRPINNLGIVGAQVFGGYLLLITPTMGLKPVPGFLVRAGLVLCFWLFQAFVWQAVIVPR